MAPSPGKCSACGAPLSTAGECSHCLSRQALAASEALMAEVSAKGVELRKAEQILRQARASFDDGNFGDARSQAESAAALIRELEAQFHQAREQLSEAERVVESFRKRLVDTGQSESLIQLAHSFLKTGNYEKAIAYSKKAIKTANEAQTRSASAKALEEKPPLPPAVARPVEEGAAPPQPAPPAAAATGASLCPACGEAVEQGWRRCPSCAGPLARPEPGKEEAPRALISIVPTPPAPEAPARPPEPGPAKDPDYEAAEKEILAVEAELEALEKRGESVVHARNLLKLSRSFLRGGSYEKATRYARKVMNVLEERKVG